MKPNAWTIQCGLAHHSHALAWVELSGKKEEEEEEEEDRGAPWVRASGLFGSLDAIRRPFPR